MMFLLESNNDWLRPRQFLIAGTTPIPAGHPSGYSESGLFVSPECVPGTAADPGARFPLPSPRHAPAGSPGRRDAGDPLCNSDLPLRLADSPGSVFPPSVPEFPPRVEPCTPDQIG